MKPGLTYGIPEQDYHADPCPVPSLSSTIARILLNQSPRHAWTAHPRLNPNHEPENKRTFDVGRAAHRTVLGRGADYAAYPPDVLASNGAVSTKAAKEWEAEARAAGLTPLKQDDADLMSAVADSLSQTLDQMGMHLDPDFSEVAAFAQIDGAWCRALIDNAPEGSDYLVDLKTTTDASPDGCIRAVTNYGLDVQAAHYLDTWRAATGEGRTMRFVFVEKAPPFAVGVVQLYAASGDEADWMDDARGKIAHAREIWAECLEADQWPSYPPMIATIGAPGWYRDRWSKFGANVPRPQRVSREALRAATTLQAPEVLT